MENVMRPRNCYYGWTELYDNFITQGSKCEYNLIPCRNIITYEGKEGGKEKFEGETGEQRRDEEERQEPMLKKWKFYNYFLSSRTFQIFFCLKGGSKILF